MMVGIFARVFDGDRNARCSSNERSVQSNWCWKTHVSSQQNCCYTQIVAGDCKKEYSSLQCTCTSYNIYILNILNYKRGKNNSAIRSTNQNQTTFSYILSANIYRCGRSLCLFYYLLFLYIYLFINVNFFSSLAAPK